MPHKFSMAGRFLAAVAAIMLLAAAAAVSDAPKLADTAPERYTVQKGDTLWGLAGKFLRDPWRWPDLWRMNREQIRNPHLIYPGDVLVLDRTGGPDGAPVLTMARPTVRLSPTVRATPLESEAVPSIPPADLAPYLTYPLITGTEGLPDAAEIVAGRDRRVVRGTNDIVYAAGLNPEGGDLWYIYRAGRRLVSGSGEFLGVEHRFLGTARTERFAEVSTLRIVSAKEEILVGDQLLPAPREQLMMYVPHPPGRAVDGLIIATNQDASEVGRGSIVILDRGAVDGIDVGAVLAIYHRVPPIADPRPSKEPDRVKQFVEQTLFFQPDRYVHVPDERTGLVFVFRVFDRVSYAFVLNTTDPVTVGDWVRQP